MILRPRAGDIKAIFYYLGNIILGIGLCMLLPLGVAVLFKEWNASLDFIIGMTVTLAFGFLFMRLFYTKEPLGWTHGMIVVSASWLVAMLFSAIPLYLSGHYLGFLDASFEAMSGYTTSGLTLVQDLDHLSYSHGIWRLFMMYVGGQGMVVIALTFLIRASGALTMYVGEAKDEKILPNVINTARFIWLVSLVYLAIGTAVLGAASLYEGVPISKAVLHGVLLFMGSWSTGGFTSQSQSILYYHSPLLEIITMSIFVLGSLNFNLHYALWSGKRNEIFKNIESATFFITVLTIFSLCALGLARFSVYTEAASLFRKGFYQLISGHTTTGFMTVYARQFLLEWGGIAIVALIIAMALGASMCSTGGGIKALRIGIIFKALCQDVKRMLLPEDAVVVEQFHHIKEVILEDRHLKAAAVISICYILLYLAGAIMGMLLGYAPLQALFESVSASANVGLSCGITKASMPALLKWTYMFQMWIGRLEFMSVFALFGFIIAIVKGK